MTSGASTAISNLMKLRLPWLRWVLPILLAAAPLQAQTFMLCSMSELEPVIVTAHDSDHSDDCCCNDPPPARDCDDVHSHGTQRQSEDCCDEIVALNYAPEEQSDGAKPASPRADPEPAKTLAVLQTLPEPRPAPAVRAPLLASLPWAASGSRLYLLTERLRI